uniref:Uncharacterized protein n=1 Tax=Euplotes crassus TaxID=5936 RepID=A0A7S3K972_EUPCR|mmetsp:Transcript_16088/g.15805  ORF Transcript_16088/g.15805 Transcript_16088/m.15805 type:complete len:117 (+) Transcript_16088:245-595(+)
MVNTYEPHRVNEAKEELHSLMYDFNLGKIYLYVIFNTPVIKKNNFVKSDNPLKLSEWRHLMELDKIEKESGKIIELKSVIMDVSGPHKKLLNSIDWICNRIAGDEESEEEKEEEGK